MKHYLSHLHLFVCSVSNCYMSTCLLDPFQLFSHLISSVSLWPRLSLPYFHLFDPWISSHSSKRKTSLNLDYATSLRCKKSLNLEVYVIKVWPLISPYISQTTPSSRVNLQKPACLQLKRNSLAFIQSTVTHWKQQNYRLFMQISTHTDICT